MSKPSFQEWDVEEVQSKIDEGVKLDIIDVREDDEWESGHIPQAKHIALGTLQERHTELDSDQLTIVVCRSGARSARACEYLTQLGYQVVNMSGGMLEWEGPVIFGE
ncbi:rhodanese-like domain-containing protein [Paenibacillus crassostreae]|uniref:Sulfurtransferase n=1 Tax=Paenibacillus crassostreae TaxID=1763538 RepID=A0A167GHL8_9BACL|nr:rhodanese-like domain-containing protein [Paenibacillus crassostreae]AOZ92122.1 sulfurtransferase [Paenibacillus crassostreae]OAB77583.1 sulfurtransferase [Paenibacillus crassostreae]